MSGELNRYYTRLCLWTVGLFAAFRLLVMGRTGLGDSESYYWCWSQRLDWSYYDHPPMVAWLIRIFTDIGGDSSFMVRLPSILLFVLLCWLLYRLSMDLFHDARVAFYSILAFNLIPEFGIASLQMVPDIPSAVCYLAYVLLINRLLVNDGPARYWYFLGSLIGVGLLGKYFVILLVPCTLLLVAAIPEYRQWYLRWQPYTMALTALFFFAPVIIWNVQNDWPSFKFHLVERHGGSHFTLNNIGEFVGGQLLYVSPIYLAGLLWAVVAGYSKARKGDRRYALLFCFSAPTLLFFYLVCMWTNEAEPHWPAFGYLTALVMMSALGVEITEKGIVRQARRARIFYWSATAFAGLIFVLFYVHVFHPILPIKPKYDLVNELYGWDTTTTEMEKLYQARIVEQTGAEGFMLAHHWVLCSQIMFGVRDREAVACVNDRRDQFDFWGDDTRHMGKDAIVVTDLRFQEPPDQLYRFDSVEKAAVLPVLRGGQLKREFTLWVGRNFQGLRKQE
ncbi:MAG: glycosyltransferase family 39 protein [Nitrospinota bacterium]|nr:glycosyltransferase family 39 protein [Nitrospinota bacterium]